MNSRSTVYQNGDELLIDQAFESLYSQNVLRNRPLPKLKKIAKRRYTKSKIKSIEEDTLKHEAPLTRLQTSPNQTPSSNHVISLGKWPSSDANPPSDVSLGSHGSNTTRSEDDYVEYSDSGYPDLASPNINGSLDALEVSIIGYTKKQYDSVGDLFMMHKPRKHRCELGSQRLNLERLWARVTFSNPPNDGPSHDHSQQTYKSSIFLKRNLCKRKFAAYMKSMKTTCNNVDKSSNKKNETSSRNNMTCQRMKSKGNYKDNKLKKIKLDIEKVKVDCDSDGVAVVQTWRRKEIVKKGMRRKSVENPNKKVLSSTLKSSSVCDKKDNNINAVKSVGVCLPRKKMTKTTKDEHVFEDESVSGVFKSLFSTYNNLGIHCGGVWKEIVSEDTK